MARRPELERFAAKHGLKIGSIEELIRYRLATEHTVERVDEREIDTAYGAFTLVTYRDRIAHDLHFALVRGRRSEEHTSELQSLMRISYAVFCLKKKTKLTRNTYHILTLLLIIKTL